MAHGLTTINAIAIVEKDTNGDVMLTWYCTLEHILHQSLKY